jgi:uncharacterized protein (DUF2384 family)
MLKFGHQGNPLMATATLYPTPAFNPGSAPSIIGPERFSPEQRRRLSGPGMRTFLAIANLWGLTEDQRRMILGMPPRSTFHGWVKAAREHSPLRLDLDTLLRISAVLGIHQALGVLFTSEREADRWLHMPHAAPVFGGKPPLALMTCGTQDGLLSVRRFLDAARGGLYMPPNSLDAEAQALTDADIVFS